MGKIECKSCGNKEVETSCEILENNQGVRMIFEKCQNCGYIYTEKDISEFLDKMTNDINGIK